MKRAEVKTEIPSPPVVSPPPAPPRVPDHELIRRIGRGAYGEVWLARSVTGAYRAVKIVSAHSFEDTRPFEREFSGILKFEPISRKHDSQVHILHVGRGEECFYYVMELADDQFTGQQIQPDTYAPKTLSSEVFQRGRLPFEDCLQISLALATALEHLHSYGLVHRDIKPSNIIFVNGVPKLADIGLVTALDATRSYVGTEGFAPPEGPGSPQADIYSLGKVLYEICTGKDRQDFPELPTDLDVAADRVGLLELNAVIGKACRQDPHQRYASARSMRDELLVLQSGKSLARLRTVERTLARLKRFSAVGIGIAAAAAAAFLWQSHQARQLKVLAMEARQNLYAADINAAQRALQTDNVREAIELLRKQMPKAGELDLRGFEWRYLWRQCQSDELFSMAGHQGAGTTVTFSPDGRMLASAGRDKTARIWDLTAKCAIATLTNESWVESVCFAPSGELLAEGSRTSVRIWDLKTLLPIRTLPGAFLKPRFSPTGPYLVTACTNGLTLWDTRTWTTTSTYTSAGLAYVRLDQTSGGCEFSVAFSNDGTKIGVAADEGVTLFSVPDLKPIDLLKDPSPRIRFVAFSSDGQTLAASTLPDKCVKLWNLKSHQELKLLSGHSDTVASAAFSPDGQRLATASLDQTVKLWNVANGEVLRTLKGHAQEVWNIAFSPDGKSLASVGKDGTVKVWDAVTLPSTNSGLQGVIPIDFAADGDLIALTNISQTLAALDPETLGSARIPEHLGEFSPKDYDIGIELDRNGNMIAFIRKESENRSMQVWDYSHDRLLCSIHETVDRLLFAPQTSLLAACTSNETVSVWHLPDATKIAVLTNTFDATAFSSDGTMLATRRRPESGPVDLWSFKGKAVRQLATWDVGDWPESIDFSPDGQMVALTTWDAVIKLLAVPSGRQIGALTGHKRLGFLLRFSPDGRTLASLTDDGTVRLWHVSTGRALLDLSLPIVDGHGFYLDFSPDGRSLAAARKDFHGELTQIWFAPSLAEIAVAEGEDYRALAHDAPTWFAVGKALTKRDRLEEAVSAFSEALRQSAGNDNLESLKDSVLRERSELLRRLGQSQ